MKVTFILKDLSDYFYNGYGNPGEPCYSQGLNNKTDLEKFEYLKGPHCRDLQITMKVGHADSFRDKVELNQILRKENKKITYKLEPRRGYKLATFEIE